MSALTHSLEDGDITIFRLLWLCRCLDLMQGQHVWALSNIRVKELDIGGQLLHFHILIFCLHIQMSHLVCLLIIVNELHIFLACIESFVILNNSD